MKLIDWAPKQSQSDPHSERSAPSPRKEMDSALKTALVPLLRARGFKGTYPHFRRERNLHMEIFGVQFSQWGGQFYIEIAIGPMCGVVVGSRTIYANDLKHYHCARRIRLGGNFAFDYERDGVLNTARKACAALEDMDQWLVRQ